MIISEQQARIAARVHDTAPLPVREPRPDVSPELMRKILGIVDALPETRSDRVAEARDRLLLGVPSSADIAEKILARVVGDHLR